ncbi:MAG: ATP-binding protein, partial [Candidatus Zixiibacteriota bacterium]
MLNQNEHEMGTALPPELAGTRMPRYRKLRRNIASITSLVALVPLVILAGINYFQDREAYRAESNFSVSQILSNTKRTLESVIEERQSALLLIIQERSYADLASDTMTATTLQNLKNSFGGFVDFGVINPDGVQTHYSGPYDLKGRNYKDQSWFHEVILRGAHVSDVFMGHRNFPHFVIAFKNERKPGDYYIIRSTIDMELVNRQVYSFNYDRNTDVFIVNSDGILQTESIFYGPVLQKADIVVPTASRKREVVEEREENGVIYSAGYAYIEGTPFILMVLKKLDHPFRHWLQHRSDVLWFLLLSSAVILIVILYESAHMTKQLREADLRRVRTFHNIEYTNKMATIGRMAAGVAHEINNPMAIINEKAGLIQDIITYHNDFPMKDKILSQVDTITKSVDRCSQVTHRLLGFAKRMEVKKEFIELSELLKEVVGFQSTELGHRNIEINYDFQKDVPHIESDRGQLQQVFLNLLSNAIAAVEEEGKIDISLANRQNKGVVIAITDNGAGISEENLKHIFEPFYSTKGEFGTGLGLSITRDIVEKLGGTIEALSVQDKGTRFIVGLPIQKG